MMTSEFVPRGLPSGLALALAVVLLGVAASAGAQSAEWQPPEPAPDEFDWVQLNSGEWLGGEIKSLRDQDLEFDSDELDLLKLDITDVAAFRSSRILTYRFEDIGVFTGTATMKAGIVTVVRAGQPHEFPREKLILIQEGTNREIDFWSFYVSLGLIARAGNTEQTDLNTKMQISRRSPKVRGILNYLGNWGEVGGEQTINNHNFNLTIDALIAAGFYVTPFGGDLYSDKFQNIDLRTTLAVGVGYAIYRSGPFEWSVGLGGGYLNIDYISVQEGQEPSESSATIIPNTLIEWEITGDIDLDFDFTGNIGLGDPRNSFYHSFLGFSVDILGDLLDLEFSLTWDHVTNPVPNAEGELPRKDDLRTVFGLGLDI